MNKIKYKVLSGIVNHGPEENPVMEEIFLDVTVDWSEANEEIAKLKAYNGEYEVFDDGQPEPETPSTVWDELDAAYREGVDSV